MNGSGILGILILFILFNILSRIIRAVSTRKAGESSIEEKARTKRESTPLSRKRTITSEYEGYLVKIGERLDRNATEISNEEGFSREEGSAFESWLEEIFEQGKAPQSAESPMEKESAETVSSSEEMHRYASFDAATEPDYGSKEFRRKATVTEAYGASQIQSKGETVFSSLPYSQGKTIMDTLKNVEGLRSAIVNAEIIGPCKARIFQSRRRRYSAYEASS